MKYARYIFLISSINLLLYAVDGPRMPRSMKINMIVDTSCAKCQFKMEGIDECFLAVEINSEHYLIDDNIINFFDGSSENKFCKKIKKAHVKGEIFENEFFLQSFKIKNQPRNR
jgi:hypothetical protein